MKRSSLGIFSAAFFVSLISAGAFGHHSAAMYDRDKTVEISGTLKEIFWNNPHIEVVVIVIEPDRTTTEWHFEGNPPAWLLHAGVKKSDLTKGINTNVTVGTHPFRDGRPAGQLLSIKFSDGSQIMLA